MLTLKECAKKVKCSVTTIKNRMKDTDGIKELFEYLPFTTKNNVIRHAFYIKEENVKIYKKRVKENWKRKNKKGEFNITETVLECYNMRFRCKYCKNNRYCPPDKPLQLLVLDLIEKGALKRWD